MRPIVSIAILLSLSSMSFAAPSSTSDGVAMDPAAAARFAGLALKCLHDEYPNHISLTMDRDTDAHPPRELTPAFYGCFDWHSAVNSTWTMVAVLKQFPLIPAAASVSFCNQPLAVGR